MSMATNRAAAAAQSNNIPLGITLMVITTFVFAVQDGLSRHLASEYNVMMVVMIRYWFFAAFVIALAKRHAGGLRAAARTSQPVLQIFRGLLLAAEICVMIVAFTILGLVESHAVFTCYPLLVAALSGPVLGESVGWRRWAAIGVGFIGVLIILQPGMSVFDPAAVIPLVAAAMFAVYGLLTRYVGLLIRCYEVAEASAVQPFAYLQLVFAAIIGISAFGETVRPNVAIGAALIVAAGLFTFWRERQKGRAR
jgi:drug/metabolite transporter (DMT)-like permease